MDAWTLLVLIALAGVVFSLVSGIFSMAIDGDVAHYDSAHWMTWRVGLQAVAFVMVLLALTRTT